MVVLHDDARCEHQGSGLEMAIDKGGFHIAEGGKSSHCEPIHYDGGRFNQEEQPQAPIDEVPKGGLEVEGSVRSLYGYNLSDDLAGDKEWVCIDFIVSPRYQPNTVAPFRCPQ